MSWQKARRWILQICRERLLVLACLCGACDSPEYQASETTEVRLLVQSSQGESISGATLQIARDHRPAKRVVLSDSSEAVRSVPLGQSLSLQASCPAGYQGESLHRHLSASLLKSSSVWTFELNCEAKKRTLALGVLASDCGELEVSVAGKAIGQTRDGVLHRLVSMPSGSSLQLSAQSKNPHCIVVNPSDEYPLHENSRALFVRLETQGRKVAPRRRKLEKKSNEARPYRL